MPYVIRNTRRRTCREYRCNKPLFAQVVYTYMNGEQQCWYCKDHWDEGGKDVLDNIMWHSSENLERVILYW